MRHLKITNKIRFTVSLSIILGILFFIFSIITSKTFSYQKPEYMEIAVSQGDTLWSIAGSFEGNIRENIYLIQKINKMENCDIYVGQKLLVPSKQ